MSKSNRHWPTTCAGVERTCASCARSSVHARAPEANRMSSPHPLSRREFLKLGGLVVSFAVPVRLAFAENVALPASATTAKTVAPDQVDGYLAVDRQGKVTVYSGKLDLGPGVRTAIAQIAAEELDVAIARISVIQGDTLLTPDQGPTY